MALDAEQIDEVVISEELIRRFDKSGPRYTSYPTADRFQEGFASAAYVHALRQRQLLSSPPTFFIVRAHPIL